MRIPNSVFSFGLCLVTIGTPVLGSDRSLECEDTEEWCKYEPNCKFEDVKKKCPKLCGICKAGNCMDDIQNQDETGVDCGGICVEKWGKWKECDPSYRRTEFGQRCSDIANEIQSETECKQAAKKLKLKYYGSFKSDSEFPACFYGDDCVYECGLNEEPENSVFFNLSPNPDRSYPIDSEYSAICKTAEDGGKAEDNLDKGSDSESYIRGNLAVRGCPHGYSIITDSSECRKACDDLGIPVATISGGHPCYEDSENNCNQNGQNGEGAKFVCKKSA